MTSGLDEILANITKLQVQNKRAARDAVGEGAEKFAENLESNTPIDDGDLAGDVQISNFKGGAHGTIEKDVGYGTSTGYRVKYPDDGTIHQRPQNFKEKTIEQSTGQIKEIFAKKIQEGLKL